jgi:hypothetical protein
MERRLSCDTRSRLAGQEILCFSWNPMVHCLAYKSSLLDPDQSQSVLYLISFRSTLILCPHLRTGILRTNFLSCIVSKMP